MKLNFLLLLALFLFGLNSANAEISRFNNSYTVALQKDSSLKSWIDDFKSFRNAVYNNDTAKLKSYFSFPVSGTNDIWYILLDGKEFEEKKINDTTRFTESDFSKYHKKLFTNYFIKALLKIKSEDLLKKGKSQSPTIKDGDTNIHLYASYSKKEKIVTLNLSYNTPGKEKDGVMLDGFESNVIYSFRILKNNRLQFVKVMIAG